MAEVVPKVEISQSGRGGTIYYAEGDSRLSFDWEFSMTGTTIFVPTPGQWDRWCDASGFAEAKGRRDEILPFVAVETTRQKTSGARFEISDNWIEILF